MAANTQAMLHEKYLLRAAECRRLADRMTSEQAGREFRRLAQEWEALAELRVQRYLPDALEP